MPVVNEGGSTGAVQGREKEWDITVIVRER